MLVSLQEKTTLLLRRYPWVKYCATGSCALLLGLTFFLVFKNRLIIHWASGPDQHTLAELQKNVVLRKKIFLYFCNSQKKIEKTPIEVLWSQHDHQATLTHIIGAWITYLQEEKLIARYVSLESVAHAPATDEIIISLSQSPFEPDWPIIQKWYCIESLCKTIKEAGIPASYLMLLINNHVIDDDHLSFAQPWPIDGFQE